MNTTLLARSSRGPLRVTALCCAGLVSGAALLLAGCSQAGTTGSASSASGSDGSHAAAGPALPPGSGAPAVAQPGSAAQPGSVTRSGPAAASGSAAQPAQPARQALATQSIIFTASLTVRSANVAAAASQATSLVSSEGGYVSSEQTSASPGDRTQPTVSLQLKIPVAVYQPTLSKLARLGAQVSLSEQAEDVTEQVADVNSLVTSAQDAISQLEALLKRAGSIADLLSVQDQINEQESSLEALQAQQRALAGETSYATVSMTLLGPKPARPPAKKHKRQQQHHGFVAGLASGWRSLRIVVSAVLTALGAVLPFAAVIVVLAGAGYAARRWLLRRRSRPTAAE